MGTGGATVGPAPLVTDAIALLSGSFAGLAEGVAAGEYLFWLGSGISFSRVEGLPGIVKKVLEFVRDRIDPADPDGPAAESMERILQLTNLPVHMLAEVDVKVEVDAWPNRDLIVSQLVSRYSEMLDVGIDGEAADVLLWDGADVCATYAVGAVRAGPEHLCLAVLALEGVTPDVASGNWDPFIEFASAELGCDPGDTFTVCVRGDDFPRPRKIARLLKFHGCARLAAADPARYRDFLVARRTQLQDWITTQAFAVMRTALVDLAATNRTLVLGYSAQDEDIVNLFATAGRNYAWPWPDPKPARVFAEEGGLSEPQVLIVRQSHDAAAYSTHGSERRAEARFPFFALPLLVALVLVVLRLKLVDLIRLAEAPGLDASGYANLESGLSYLQQQIAESLDGDLATLLRDMFGFEGRFMGVFLEGRDVAPPPITYRPLSNVPAGRTAAVPSLAADGVREMAVALALIGAGARDGSWSVRAARDVGGLRIDFADRTVMLLFFANQTSRIRFERDADPTVLPTDVIMALSHGMPASVLARAPSRAPGRTGASRPRVLNLVELIAHASDPSDLERRFRREALI